MSLTFDAIDAAWWPFLFILLAGGLATDIWRWLGVLAGHRLRDDSEALIWVRAVATALVAGVIGKLVLFPTGALATLTVPGAWGELRWGSAELVDYVVPRQLPPPR